MITKPIRLAIAQIDCTVGDLSANTKKIIANISQAEKNGADIVSFPELSICGYPPEDLLLKPGFIKDNLKCLDLVAKQTGNIAAVVGFVDIHNKIIRNAAAVIYKGKVIARCYKMILPNYGVFDEDRYFQKGANPLCFRYGGIVFGVNICEDIWFKNGPAAAQSKMGAKLIVNINASPYHYGKVKLRQELIESQARSNSVILSYGNLVGGQDELVFDGHSMILNAKGKILAMAGGFKEEMLYADIDVPVTAGARGKQIVTIDNKPVEKYKPAISKEIAAPMDSREEVYSALVLGLRDYVKKNGFKKVVIGLSGGIDSAIVAVIAVDALGSENVTGVAMPSRFTSNDSKEDALILAKNLGIRLMEVPIEGVVCAYLSALGPLFDGKPADITEENLQSRIRGNIVMALSNKFGWLVLTTGNKSEMSTGYATLYGDMAGGFAVIKDVHKTLVYELARYRNLKNEVIPVRTITKEPTAELKPNQKDTDTLPPYETLDSILKAYIEKDLDTRGIVKMGFDEPLVKRVLRMVDKSEYKRRQSPPGIKITARAFGKDRRMPITNKYEG